MTILAVSANGAIGHILEFAVPLIVVALLVGLFYWSFRKPKAKRK